MERKVLVTGANSGIGLATSILLARTGFSVTGAVRNEAGAEALTREASAASLPIAVVVLDLAEAEAVDQFRPQGDGFWALVNNAGHMNAGALQDVSMDSVRGQFETMVFSPLRLALTLLPAMIERGDGRIVNIASAATHVDLPMMGWYAAAKQALTALTFTLRAEVADLGVEVAAIEPGAIRTAIWDHARTDLAERARHTLVPGLYEQAQRAIRHGIPAADEPACVAEVVAEVLTSGHTKPVYRVDLTSKSLAASSRLLPRPVRAKLVELGSRFGSLR